MTDERLIPGNDPENEENTSPAPEETPSGAVQSSAQDDTSLDDILAVLDSLDAPNHTPSAPVQSADIEVNVPRGDGYEDGEGVTHDEGADTVPVGADEAFTDELEDEDEYTDPDPTPQGRPNVQPYRPPQDRFPPLPEELRQQARLKPPPRPQSDEERRLASRRIDRRPPSRAPLYNFLTIVFALATCGALYWVIAIWQDPYSALNPFAPNTPFPILASQTPTPSLTPTTAPTNTPTNTPTITLTPTFEPSATFTPVPLSELGISLGTPGASAAGGAGTGGDPLATPAPNFPFALQVIRGSTVVYITNPEGRGGCNWSSITGTVIDFNGAAVDGYGVRIVGDGVDQTLATGSNRAAGAGGFELQLGDQARAASYTVQLLDPSGRAVSDVYPVETSADCAFNIAAVRFVATAP